MFETNTQNNSSLISLAQAAAMTGYHQDYLGQLCRLGRLPAKKVGRNWFTSKLALQNLTNSGPAEVSEDAPEAVEEFAQPEVAAPEIAQNVTVSRVEGMPIMIRTLSTPVRSHNHVQSLVTQMRIEALQKEVLELRQLLARLMAEVTRHGELLQGRNFSDLWRRQDALKHQYISNFDFDSPTVNYDAGIKQEQLAAGKQPAPQIWSEPKRQIPVMTLIVSVSVMAALAFLGTSMLTGTFWGSGQSNQTVYYHPKEITPEPAVAGVNSEQSPNIQSIPQNPGSEPINVVQ